MHADATSSTPAGGDASDFSSPSAFLSSELSAASAAWMMGSAAARSFSHPPGTQRFLGNLGAPACRPMPPHRLVDDSLLLTDADDERVRVRFLLLDDDLLLAHEVRL